MPIRQQPKLLLDLPLSRFHLMHFSKVCTGCHCLPRVMEAHGVVYRPKIIIRTTHINLAASHLSLLYGSPLGT